jgi:hypothetical protein
MRPGTSDISVVKAPDGTKSEWTACPTPDEPSLLGCQADHPAQSSITVWHKCECEAVTRLEKRICYEGTGMAGNTQRGRGEGSGSTGAR